MPLKDIDALLKEVYIDQVNIMFRNMSIDLARSKGYKRDRTKYYRKWYWHKNTKLGRWCVRWFWIKTKMPKLMDFIHYVRNYNEYWNEQ